MTKGKFGVCLWFYAALAFILALLDQTLLCGILLLFVIAVEGDEWTTKQVMQAFFITLAVSVISMVLNLLGDIVGWIPFLGSIAKKVFNVVLKIVDILKIVLAIIGLVKVSKCQDANIPGLSAFADKAFGVVVKKTYAPVQPQYQQPPVQYQTPPQPQQPVPPQQNVNPNQEQ